MSKSIDTKNGILLIILTSSILVCCRPKVKVKDYRKLSNNMFVLTKANTPCFIGSDKKSQLSLTAATDLNSVQLKAISEYKSRIPKTLNIEIKKVFKYSNSTHVEFSYFHKQTEICDSSLKLHFTNENMSVTGGVSTSLSVEPSYNWDELDINLLRGSPLLLEHAAHDINILSSTRCLAIEKKGLIPVSRLELLINQEKYRAEIHNNNIRVLSQAHFDLAEFNAEGRSNTYAKNTGSETKSFTLRNLQTNSPHLCGKNIIISRSSERNLVKSKSRVYNYAVGTRGFKEASAFTNAQQTIAWLSSLGWNNWLSGQINIFLDANKGPSYDPHTSLPTLNLPDTMDDLNHLQADKDVMIHELGHHYLSEFWPLRTVNNPEFVVMHEAISDFLTAARSGNSCIAERICKNSEVICINKSCLRDLNNSLKYSSSEYHSLAVHQKSQAISGMLWQAHAKNKIDLERLVKIITAALPYTNPDIDVQNFINVLLDVAKKSSNASQKYHCDLYDASKTKNLDSLIINKKELDSCSA